MTTLEQALEHIDNSKRKGSKSSAWNEAKRAAEIADAEVFGQDGRPNWPDLIRLEKDVRVALGADTVIVTRHTGLVAWLAQHGISGNVVDHATASDVRGKHVIGALPLHLAALAAKVTVVDMPNLPAEKRGQDLTPDEMDSAGAALKSYQVRIV